MVWGAISYNWKSPLIFFGWYREAWGSGIGLFITGVRTGGRTRFSGLVGYKGYRAQQEEDEKWGIYVEDHAPVNGSKQALVEAKRVLEIPLHERPSSSPDLNPDAY
jgi:hypothetical protein